MAKKYTFFVVSLLLLLGAVPASAVEHPGAIPKGAKCASCHADKTRGKSVHAAMETPCTTCHLEMTQGDLTNLQLAAPKEELCFACHQASPGLGKHVPDSKRQCLDCHDPHRSNRRVLLRDRVATVMGSAQNATSKPSAK